MRFETFRTFGAVEFAVAGVISAHVIDELNSVCKGFKAYFALYEFEMSSLMTLEISFVLADFSALIAS